MLLHRDRPTLWHRKFGPSLAFAAAMPSLRLILTCLLGALAVAPTASAAELARAGLSVAGTTGRSCVARPATAPGVVRRTVTASASGLVRARLFAAGDWDLGVFDASTGRMVAGAAGFGGSELAEGVVRVGQTLVVQACRRTGAGSVADLQVGVLALDPPSGEKIRVARVTTGTQFARDAVVGLGFDDTHHATPGFMDVILHDEADLASLRASGLEHRILVDDLVAADTAALQGGPSARSSAEPEPLPSGRLAYRRLPDFGEDMKRLVAENPQFVRPVVLPHKTLEGRTVEGVEISRDVNGADGKPVFLQMGVHHAREWPSGELAMEWAFEMVRGLQAGDERTTRLLDRIRVIVIPIVNPDGYNLSRESLVDAGQPIVDPGFAYKRKNCRMTDFAVPAEGECGQQANRALGVDPNRNYGGSWGGGGASDQKTSDTYRGADPFSEPESQNIRELISGRQVVALITNHTYGDLLLRPPGLAGTPPTPDDEAYKALGAAMAAENGYQNLYSYELYDTTGTTEDWSYFATGGFGFTFEIGAAYQDANVVGEGFHPPYPAVLVEWSQSKYGTGGGNREAYYKISEWAADPRNHSVLTGKAPAGSVIRLHKQFATPTSEIVGEHPQSGLAISLKDELNSSTVVPTSGVFEYHVNPSSRPLQGTDAYSLTCEAPDGTVLGRRQVVVGRGESRDLGMICAGEGLGPGQGAGGLIVAARARKTALRKALAKGLRVTVTCSKACDAAAALVRGKRRVASGRSRAIPASRTVTVRFTKKSRKALRRARKVVLTLRVTATAGAERAAASRKVTLRR
jgi:Zinc carboxypeptidase